MCFCKQRTSTKTAIRGLRSLCLSVVYRNHPYAQFLNLLSAKSTRLALVHAWIRVMRVTLYPLGMKNMAEGRGIVLKKICCGLLFLSLIVLLAACGTVASTRSSSSSSITSDSLGRSVQTSPLPTPTSMPMLSIPSQITTPTPTATPRIIPTSVPKSTPTPPVSNCITFSNDTTLVPPANGGLGAPYGPSPVTTEAQQITGELFQLVNHDRAACGLPPFAWNATLASGALLHSWNMYHCGLSHTCPDGMTQYQRIANEGFARLSRLWRKILLLRDRIQRRGQEFTPFRRVWRTSHWVAGTASTCSAPPCTRWASASTSRPTVAVVH